MPFGPVIVGGFGHGQVSERNSIRFASEQRRHGASAQTRHDFVNLGSDLFLVISASNRDAPIFKSLVIYSDGPWYADFVYPSIAPTD